MTAQAAEFDRLGAALRAEAAACSQRRALVLAGTQAWCREAALAVLRGAGVADPLWVGNDAPVGQSLPAPRACSQLGTERSALLFDAHAGFDPDALGAVAGTVAAGGLLLLLTPPLAAWPAWPDPEKARIAVHPVAPEQVSGRFLDRIARVLREPGDAMLIEEGDVMDAGASIASRARLPALPTPRTLAADECRTAEQARAVEAIQQVATGHRRRPLVLTSDRGRGKSAALGIAAARLLRLGAVRIVATAPRPAATEALFAHAARALPAAVAREGRIELGAGVIEFMAPDRLAAADIHADLVLVDEAAAIPTALLARLLDRHARIVFATTVHGYEGAGRGFALRFTRMLDASHPGWRALTLTEPVRWAEGDPVERWVNRLLLLDAEAADRNVLDASAPLVMKRIDRDRLLEDEPLLRELFGLLVLAHYRTRPFDLRQLLDGPNLQVWIARCGPHVAATALVAEEGGMDAALAADIAAGRRRPRGHLIPQSLATHAGVREAPLLRCARVMRIAVHPAVQGRGIGTQLMTKLTAVARAEGFDSIGSSFGGDPAVIRFWHRSALVPVRVGLSRESSSGAPSVMVLRPLTAAGEALFAAARGRFSRTLPELLGEPLAEIDPELALALLRDTRQPEPDAQDRAELTAFVAGEQGYEMCARGLRAAALASLAGGEGLDEEEMHLLMLRLVQRRGWAEVATRLRLAGRAGIEKALRSTFGRICRRVNAVKLSGLQQKARSVGSPLPTPRV